MSFPADATINHIRAALKGLSGDLLAAELQRQFSHLSVPALATDAAGQYVAASPPALALTGYSLREVLERSVFAVTPAGSVADGYQLWSEFVEDGQQHGQYDLRTRDGSIMRVRYHAYADVTPGVHVSVFEPLAARDRGPLPLRKSGRVLH